MEKWDIETHPPPVRRSGLLWLALYPFAWLLLFSGSNMFWFLPAGLRLATLWILPRRWWWLMALLEWMAILGLSLTRDSYQSLPGLLFSTTLPWIVCALVVRGIGRHGRDLPSLDALPRLLVCGVVAAMFTTIALTAIDLNDDGELSGSLTSMLFGYALGDFAGVVIALPILLVLHDQTGPDRMPWTILTANGLVLGPVAVALALSTLHGMDAPVYPLVLSLLPMFVIAYRFGWRQGAIALGLLVPAIHPIGGALAALWSSGQLQLLIAVSGCAALLLGVSNEKMRVKRDALSAMVQTLSLRSNQLAEAANRIASLQEQERRRIGVELHDQIGQDMTAIATRLRIIEHKAVVPEVREGMSAIGRLVSEAHGHLREVINELHPAVLDRFGLARALTDGPIAEMLRYADIDYRCTIQGDIETLPDNVASALYRVCQEAATNCAKHGCGGYVHIRVSLNPTDAFSSLTLEIEDRAGALDIDVRRPGRGLQNIRDRAYAIGAEYRFNMRSGEPRHALRLKVARLIDGRGPEPV